MILCVCRGGSLKAEARIEKCVMSLVNCSQQIDDYRLRQAACNSVLDHLHPGWLTVVQTIVDSLRLVQTNEAIRTQMANVHQAFVRKEEYSSSSLVQGLRMASTLFTYMAVRVACAWFAPCVVRLLLYFLNLESVLWFVLDRTRQRLS
jgi:hypothetical protein